MSWHDVSFEQLYEIPSKNGLTRPSRVRGSGYKMINMGELFANDRIGTIEMERVPMNEKELEKMLVSDGDLLFARQSLVLAGAGKCSIVSIVEEPTTFESHIIRVRLNKMLADPSFYYYYFRSPKCRIRSIVTQGVQAGIRASDLAKLIVHHPPLDTQKRIADTLSAYDDLIENNRRRIQLLEQAARLLYKEWFVNLRFPGHEHVKIEDGVPEGWEKKTIGELVEVTMGQSPESKYYNETGEGLPFHQGVADFGDRFVTHRIHTIAKNRIANAGDILCSVRAPVGRLNITLDKIVIGRGLAALRSRSDNQSFLLYQLRTHFFKEDLIGSGAIFASVTKTEFKNQKMLTPPKKLIQAFEDVSIPIDDQLRVLFLQNEKLKATRDLLLPRLMNGEVAV